MAVYPKLLLAASTVTLVYGLYKLFYPAQALQLISPEASARVANEFSLFSQLEGLDYILISAIYCVLSRNPTPKALIGVAVSHLLVFIAILVYWPSLVQEISVTVLKWSLGAHALISLLLLSEASMATKGLPRPPASTTLVYLAMLAISGAHFAAAAALFVTPDLVATYALGVTISPSYPTLLANLRFAGIIHVIVSGAMCTNARALSRSFALSVSSAAGLSAAWAFFTAIWSPGGPGPILPVVAVATAAYALFFAAAMPSSKAKIA